MSYPQVVYNKRRELLCGNVFNENEGNMNTDDSVQINPGRTAGEAGWHISRYNLYAEIPGTTMTAVVNLFKGMCSEFTPLEMDLLSVVEMLDENHPLIDRFARRGVIVKFDERAALEVMGRAACAFPHAIGLSICPTLGCNFDCPYCFQDHLAGKMTPEVQDDVVSLAERMMETSTVKDVDVTWFGGEPLLYPDVIESLSERLMGLAEARGGNYTAMVISNGYFLTQENIDMLVRCKVDLVQVTIDGLGATHDATRHLRGGGPTFERIAGNLRDAKIPFKVDIRHNVYAGNRDEADALDSFVKRLSEESGNDLYCYHTPVAGSPTADERGRQVDLLCGGDESEVSAKQEAGRFRVGHGSFCMAHTIWSVSVDACGNLHKCRGAVDKPRFSFGVAHDWDPADPFATASNPDNLTMYLNTACPVPDEECRECMWLPMCVGGCPHRRLSTGRDCVPFKDNPEEYVLALHARMANEQV